MREFRTKVREKLLEVGGIANDMADDLASGHLDAESLIAGGHTIRAEARTLKRYGHTWARLVAEPLDPEEPEPVEPGDPRPDPEPGHPPTTPVDPPMGFGDVVLPVRNITKKIRKNGGSCMTVKQDNKQLHGIRFEYAEWMGLSIPKYDPVDGTVGLIVNNCEFYTGWAGDRKGWGIRAYDLGLFDISNSDFTCALPLAKNIEHGAYFNIWAGGIFDGCYFVNLPGQALQFVGLDGKRAIESANAAGLDGKDIDGDVVLIKNSVVSNCGHFNNGRASFAISMFDSNCGMTLENVVMQKYNESRSHGAVLFQGNKGTQSLQLINTKMDYRIAPDRELVQCTNPKDVLIDGGEYRSSKGIRIVRPRGRVVVKRVSAASNCMVHISDGTKVGGKYVWQKSFPIQDGIDFTV